MVLTFSKASAEKNLKMEKLEEWRENEWILEPIIQDTVHASVNGKITRRQTKNKIREGLMRFT